MPCAKAQIARARSIDPAAPRSGEAAPRLDAGRQEVARQRPLGHEAVEMRMGEREGAVGAGDRGERVGRRARRGRELLSDVVEGRGDDRRLDLLLVAEVLVDRRRLDPESLGEAAHGQAVDTLLLDDRARRGGDDTRAASGHVARLRRVGPPDTVRAVVSDGRVTTFTRLG